MLYYSVTLIFDDNYYIGELLYKSTWKVATLVQKLSQGL